MTRTGRDTIGEGLNDTLYDVIVIGGGPAGLSAALYLARARRRVLVVDAGEPRNRKARAAHGVFTRDGVPPLELLTEARRQVERYPTIEFRCTKAVEAAPRPTGFEVTLNTGDKVRARRLLLACGVRDELPPIEGLAERWGTTVHNCTYCDGYEAAGMPLAAFANGEAAVKSVASLLRLSDDVVLCTDGTANIATNDRQLVHARRVQIIETRIVRFSGLADGLAIHFADGLVVARSAIFLSTALQIGSAIPAQLGCALRGARVVVDANWQTTVAGVYAAGDIAASSRFVAVAAASGAEAGMRLDGALIQEDFGLRATDGASCAS